MTIAKCSQFRALLLHAKMRVFGAGVPKLVELPLDISDNNDLTAAF